MGSGSTTFTGLAARAGVVTGLGAATVAGGVAGGSGAAGAGADLAVRASLRSGLWHIFNYG